MKKQLVVLSLFAVASMPAAASGFYLLAEAGQSKFTIESESDTENVIAIGGGYKFNETFALEVAYRDLGEFKDGYREDYDNGDYEQFDFAVSFSAVQASLVANFPVGESASIYGRLGMADLEVEVTATDRGVWDGEAYSESGTVTLSDNKAVYGAGFKYTFNPSFAGRLEYSQYAELEGIKTSTITAGLVYQF